MIRYIITGQVYQLKSGYLHVNDNMLCVYVCVHPAIHLRHY
jgi:hypothetical protein